MIDGKESLAEIEALSKQVAHAIAEHEVVRLISHNDADGLSAAGVMCNALYRRQILFHATIVSQFDQSTVDLVEKTSQDAVIGAIEVGKSPHGLAITPDGPPDSWICWGLD